MTQQTKTLSREEKQVLKNYAKERRKTSDDLHTYMKQMLCRDKLGAGLIFGLFLGVIFGGLNFGIGTLKIRSFDKQNLIKTELQHKQLKKKRTFSTVMIIDVLVLFILSCSLEGCRDVDEKDFRPLASQLAKGYFQKIFEQDKYTKEMANRAKHAAALIINNMPKDKIKDMRSLAIYGLSYDHDGHFQIEADAIEIAKEIISEHLEQHPEIKHAVDQIMNNEKIQTYVLNIVKQKTK